MREDRTGIRDAIDCIERVETAVVVIAVATNVRGSYRLLV